MKLIWLPGEFQCNCKMLRAALPDEVGELFEPMLPPRLWCGNGRPPKRDRDCLHALLYVLVTGIPWAMLPAGFASYTLVQRRLNAGLALDGFHHAWGQLAELDQLIPALYLERVAARSTRAEPRPHLRALSTQLLEPLRRPDHPINTLAPAGRQHLEPVAGAWADLFQRSSSCVEGRNGQRARRHHGRHRLSDRKLAALTAVHNFHIRRADGTTAARALVRPCP